ncbi:MAG: TonB-dependent receptor [Prevotella sp.]|nr:TonB-dependent receptor [Prevotella sp.]
MKYGKLVCLSLLMAVKAGTVMAQTDSLRVENDSITWDQELEGIEVKAQRQLIKQEIDRIGYDVQADEESKTQTVMDMLRKVPMVTVDGDDNIKVKGNSNFKIYKNGHYDPNLSKNAKEIFKSMPASMVKRIEVITDPGAREDAEGVDAILNIVMVDGSKFDGVTGVVNLYYNSLNHPNLYTSLTGQVGKLLLSANYGYGGMSRRETESSNDVERTFLQTGNRLLTHSEGTNPGSIHFGDINASYDIDSLNLLSASFGGYFYKLNVQGDGTTELLPSTGEDGRGSLYRYNNHYWMPGYSHQSWNGRLDFEHKTRREGELFTLSYMLALTRQHTDQENEYTDLMDAPFPYTNSLQKERERFTEHTFQIDWLRPLGKGHQLELGAKYIDRHNNSHNTQSYGDVLPETNSEFEHTTRVMAGYADYIYNKDKWSARAGLRYEYSFMKGCYPDGSGETFRHRLSDWVPQASLKYQITDAQSLKLNYTTSINRPGISYLNPAVIVSPTIIQSGNPELVSSHSQRVNLIYMFVGKRLTLQLAPGYQFSNGGIASVQTADGDVRYLTYDNIQRYRRATFEQYVQWRPFETTTLVFNNTARYEHYENPNLGYRTFGWSDNYYVNLTQKLPWRLQLSLSAYGKIGHNPSNVYYMQHSWYGYYASLQRSFLKDDRLTVRLMTDDPFDHYTKYCNEAVNGDFRDLSTSYNRGRQFAISVSYRFGSLKASVKKAERTIENDDVVGGITKGN